MWVQTLDIEPFLEIAKTTPQSRKGMSVTWGRHRMLFGAVEQNLNRAAVF